MTGPKLSKGASDRLLNLLYSATSVEIANKTPLVTKFIHDHQPPAATAAPTAAASPLATTQWHPTNTGGAPRSILDDLMVNNWNQKPFAQAAVDLPRTAATAAKSNVLKFSCRNNFVSSDTFHNLYPIKRERLYQLPEPLARRGLRFLVVKGRNPLDLQPVGAYYLIFRDHAEAAAYWLETLGKVVNGFDLRLEFVRLGESDLRHIASPYLDASLDLNHATVSASNLFSFNSAAAANFKSLLSPSLQSRGPSAEPVAPEGPINYDYNTAREFSSYATRRSAVLVKNLPFGLSKHALPKTLWDYSLAGRRTRSPITTLISDPLNQVHLTLIRFADTANATRFVRNFHGRKWEGVQTKKEKKLYEPLLCEQVD